MRAQLLIILFLFASGCSQKIQYECKDCNVIMISLDTLRADMLSSYGYELNTTPNLDSFAKESIIFTNAFSQAHWTLPSHSTVFTGLLPFHHNVTQIGYALNATTLTQIFAENDYKTFAYTGNAFVSAKTGVLKGFENTSENINNLIVHPFNLTEINQTINCNSKFLGFFHTYFPHDPYILEKDSDYFFEMPKTNISTNITGFLKKHDFINNTNITFQEASEIFLKDLLKTFDEYSYEFNETPSETQAVKLAYANKIRKTDEYLGKLFQILKEKNCLENTVVIIFSDHGDSFNEHGKYSHDSPYNTDLHVPLIIRVPGAKPDERNDVVMLADIAPTLLGLTGIKTNNSFDGTNLFNSNARNSAIGGLPNRYKYYVNGDYKLILFDDNHTEFYNLKEDVLEQNPIKISENNNTFKEMLETAKKQELP